MSEDSDETLADDAVEADLEAEETETETDADADAAAGEEPEPVSEAEPEPVNEAKAKADAVIAERKVVARRTVTSRRVTPKGGPTAAKAKGKDAADAPPVSASKARDAKKTASVVTKAPVATPQQVYAKGPSPWWVPAIMFGLLIVGALIIMTNYMGVFGDASNIRLVIGLGFILGGIVTATQYR